MANALRTNPLRNWVDRFLGRGDASVTVPPLDGALKPNNLLEAAPDGIHVTASDNLVATASGLVHSSGRRLMRQPADGGASSEIRTFAGDISAVAVSSNSTLAVASGNAISFLDGTDADASGLLAGKQDWRGITAMAFAPDGVLVVAVGSSKNGCEEWQRDLLDGEQAGSIWRVDPRTGEFRQLAGGLAYPNGLAIEPDGSIIVSEAWQKQLIRLSPDGRMLGQVMEDLPGYPARIGQSGRGGYWLSIFAPRSQLIEFVLREPDYRKTMMAEMDKAFWIAPALRSGRSFREPMQGGALKQMGILKPWAPTRSYGLVVELGADFVALRSFHSRAGGRRHGVTSAVEVGGKLWVSAKGGDELVAINLGREGN